MRRLLVFDNCEDDALLEQYRPKTGGCAILLTSRRTTWAAHLAVQPLRLAVLPDAESLALLRSYGLPATFADGPLHAVAEELGRLPLALHLAGSFLHLYGADLTPADYLAELRAAERLDIDLLESEGISATGHDQSIYRTFRLSYDRLDPAAPADALALQLLARAACFAPGEPLPRSLLAATIGDVAPRRLTAALRRLADLGLLDVEGDTVRIHRLVAVFATSVCDDATAQPAAEAAMITVAVDLNSRGFPAPLRQLQTHLQAVTARALPRADEQAATLSSELGAHLSSLGDYAAARPLLAAALRIHTATRGPDHPATASSMGSLGSLLRSLGDYAAARPLLEAALRIHIAARGPDDPATASSMGDLALLLRSTGDYAAARPLLEDALRIHTAARGPDDLTTAQSMGNLANLLEGIGDLEAARPLLEAALRITTAARGPDHPQTTQTLNNLAVLLGRLGDYAAARPLFEAALRLRTAALGPEHPLTAQSLNNLALLLVRLGDLEAARPLMEDALRITTVARGPDHPETAGNLTNLAVLLHTSGDDAAARPLFEDALRIRTAAFGPDHPATAISLSNLAELLCSIGDMEAARPLMADALRIHTAAHGPDHPTTRLLAQNLADLDASATAEP